MPATVRLYVDSCCEIVDLFRPHMHGEITNFSESCLDRGAIYVVGRQMLSSHRERLREIIQEGQAQIIFSNPYEGSETLMRHLQVYGMDDLARSRDFKIISGGDMDPCYDYLLYEHFLPKVLDYQENLEAAARRDEIYSDRARPYDFLCLNGRARSHRKYLIERLNLLGLLDRAIWTWLDSSSAGSKSFRLINHGVDLMSLPRPPQLLASHYEVDRYANRVGIQYHDPYIKYQLFDQEWGEIYINANPYVDTYFSLVTETVFTYPYSFRTEKIWKPIVMGHPWIAVANRGYYRDLRSLGIRTFDSVIDESFDLIDNDQDRLDRIISIVMDVCQNGPQQFTAAVQDICIQNQQRYAELRHQVKQDFPQRFFDWIQKI